METEGTTEQVLALESDYLGRLDRDCQQLLTYQTQQIRVQTPQEIMASLNYLQSWEQYLQTYAPIAQLLTSAGRPQLGFRLDHVRKDLQGAIGIYSQMYQSAIDFQNRIFQIQTTTNQQCFQTMISTNANTQRVFEQSQEMYNLVVNRGYPMWAADLVTKLGR